MDHSDHALSLAPPRGGLQALAALLLAVSLAACGSSDGGGNVDDTGAGSSTSSSEPTPEPEPAPSPEEPDPTTAESPSGSDNPAISVARLPVGGASELREDDPTLQCAEVSWIVGAGDGEFPKGFAVEPTRVLFTPEVFEVVGSGCGTEQPNCVGFIFRSSAQRCDLLVRLVGTIPEGTSPSVGFAGLAYCPRNDSDSCREFVASIADQKQISVRLTVPPQPEPETT